VPEAWHNRIAADCEARGRWGPAIWHLSRLVDSKYDLMATYTRRARAYVERGRVDREFKEAGIVLALEDLNQVLAAQPDNGPAYVQRAQLYLDRESWDQAIKDFGAAERQGSAGKQVWLGRAHAHARQLKWAEVIPDCQKALSREPDDGFAHAQLAEAYRNLKNWQAAATEYEHAAKSLPTHLEFRVRLATVLGQQKKRPEAIREFAAVARVLKSKGRYEQARGAFSQALALKPDRQDEGHLHAELAETCSSLAMRDEAIDHFTQAVKLEPKEWTYWRGLAWVHQSARSWKEARDAYSEAIKLKPDDAMLLKSRAWVSRQLDQWKSVAEDYETALKLEQNNASMRMWLAEAYVREDNLDAAKKCLELAAKLNPYEDLPLLRLATIHLVRGDHKSYRATCAKLVDAFEHGRNAWTANNVAWACSLGPNAVDDMQRPVRLAKKAVEIQPGNQDYIDTLGAVLYRADDLNAAMEQLGEANNPEASRVTVKTEVTLLYDRLFMAMAEQRSGHVDEANALLDKVDRALRTHAPNQTGKPATLAMDTWQTQEFRLLRDEAEKLTRPKSPK
jgi:tetratricopeptide (TPR) repeat protein